MTVKLNTIDEDLNTVWVDANICEQWISVAWRVQDANDEINLIIGGEHITVKETEELIKYVKEL